MKQKIFYGTLALSLMLTTAVPAFASVDLTKIPLGDGKVTTSPTVGSVYSCQTQFGAGQGAATNGSWIHGDTWNLSEKLSVQGSVSWPNAKFTLSTDGTTRTVTGNGLPITGTTGIFPIAQSDPAYAVDRNPNTIKAQQVSFTLPVNPVVTTPTCVPMGMIGVATNGVAIFNALDGEGRDAVAHEVQDLCGGHPERQGEYHYHGPSSCMPQGNEKNTLIGYALDGFGIYSNLDSNGKSLTNADLDACHGTTSPVLWEGKTVSMYHYVLTNEYPYTIGCFKGTPAKIESTKGGMMNPMGQQGQNNQMGMQGSTSIKGTLSIGSSGSEVTTLQRILEQKGFLVLPAGVSKGYFGNLTKQALQKYQTANSINAIGIVGPMTRALLNKVSTQGITAPSTNMQNQMSPMNNQMNSQNMPMKPPAEAVTACANKVAGVSCSFTAPMGNVVSGMCESIQSMVACKPAGAPKM